ncbi:hypothetical protein [Ruegeria halocynthiae]|uniref:hypothetical protein n=1 Tax=Ruegeria halocynthiae TaxID=985054 RepID=UPI0012680728|nr:hypothetical protein [Ruegeria halocynthiae]
MTKYYTYLFFGIFLTVLPSGLVAQNGEEPKYQTKEFSGSESVIPTAFLCMFVGQQTGIEPDATPLLLDFMLDLGGTPEQVDLWAQDAVLYINHVLPGADLEEVWGAECAAPIAKLKGIYGSQ